MPGACSAYESLTPARNSHEVTLPDNLPDWQSNLLNDPQTSGGLLVSCDPADADGVLRLFRNQDHAHASVIGTMEEGEVGVTVR